jgi:hypothetical protein
MTLGVGIGFDRERALGELSGQVLKISTSGLFKLFQSLTMLFDHPQIILSGKGRQALWDQIVSSESWADCDEVSGLPELRDGLSQNELDVTVLGPTRMILAPLDTRLPGWPGRGGFHLTGFGRLGLAFCLYSGRTGFGFGGFGIGRLGHEFPNLLQQNGDDKAPSLPRTWFGSGGAAPTQNQLPFLCARLFLRF